MENDIYLKARRKAEKLRGLRKVMSFALKRASVLALAIILCLTGCGGRAGDNETSEEPTVSIYADAENWAYTEESGKKADVFFLCPAVYMGEEGAYNMSLTDEESRASFLGAINMEKGIYDDEADFYAPYYSQMGLAGYELEEADWEEYLEIAFADVCDAFEYYLENYNEGSPIILAGFSEGADLCIWLLKKYFGNEELSDRLVACYALGWKLTAEDVEEYDWIKAAQGEDDIGVVITFNSEAEEITDSLLVHQGETTLSINPLNWRTDSQKADKSLNKGACFTNYSGEIEKEIPNLTGAYIDSERGTLKVTDVTSEDYPAVLYNIFVDGVYHLYDYQFFYRNLEENVQVRLEAYLAANE